MTTGVGLHDTHVVGKLDYESVSVDADMWMLKTVKYNNGTRN